ADEAPLAEMRDESAAHPTGREADVSAAEEQPVQRDAEGRFHTSPPVLFVCSERLGNSERLVKPGSRTARMCVGSMHPARDSCDPPRPLRSAVAGIPRGFDIT